MPDSIYYKKFSYFSKLTLSLVLLFWAVQNVSYISRIERLGILFTPLWQNPLGWAVSFSVFEIAVATGLWLPKFESSSFAAIGLLLLVQLVVGIVNLRVAQASFCPTSGFLEGNPGMILVQRTALLLMVVASFLIERDWKAHSDSGTCSYANFEMR